MFICMYASSLIMDTSVANAACVYCLGIIIKNMNEQLYAAHYPFHFALS